MPGRFEIHLYHDGEAYVADVPELPECRRSGPDRSTALTAAEAAIISHLAALRAEGMPLPVASRLPVLRRQRNSHDGTAGAPVLARLFRRFGPRSHRVLLDQMGLPDEPDTHLSAAVAGRGARWVRLAIALTLGLRPAELWPITAKTRSAREKDEADYARLLTDPGYWSLVVSGARHRD